MYSGRLLFEMGVQGAVCILAAWTQYTCDFVACIPYLCIDPISMQFHSVHPTTWAAKLHILQKEAANGIGSETMGKQSLGFTTAPEP